MKLALHVFTVIAIVLCSTGIMRGGPSEAVEEIKRSSRTLFESIEDNYQSQPKMLALYSAAATKLSAAIELAPQDPELFVLSLKANYLAALNDSSCCSGDDLAKSNFFQTGEKLSIIAIQRFPENSEILWRTSDFAKDTKTKYQLLEKVITINPENIDALFDICALMLESRELVDAKLFTIRIRALVAKTSQPEERLRIIKFFEIRTRLIPKLHELNRELSALIEEKKD